MNILKILLKQNILIDENLYNKMGKEIGYKCVAGLEETIEQED